MEIAERYREAVKKAQQEGYEVLTRVQEYSEYGNYDYIGTVYRTEKQPYLVGKPFGNITLFKIATINGSLKDITVIGNKRIIVNDGRSYEIRNREGEESVEINSEYVDGDSYYFKNPYL